MKKLLIIALLIVGCEEESEESPIIGTWTVIKFEEYENMNCTGLLDSTPIFDILSYSESYSMTEDRFTWSQTSNLSANPNTEEGTYTIIDSVITFFGEGIKHGIDGIRVGVINDDETSMSIKLQWDVLNNDYILDTCFNFTFDKN